MQETSQIHSPVMVVLIDDEDRSTAHQIANALGYPHANTVIGGPRDAIQSILALPSPPTYLVIDVGDRGEEVLEELDALSEHCEAGTRVVVIGTVNDVHFYRALKQRGVIEYFPRPVNIADIRGALHFPVSANAKSRGQVIAFMSAASGDGSSTVALNTAYSLAKIYGKRTVLVDMDYQFGMIAKNLDLQSPYGIKELFEHPDRGIDQTLITRMTIDYRDGLKVIAAPNDLRLMPSIKPESIRDLIVTLQESHEYVLIDLPHLWTTWIAAALSNAQHHVLVGQLWLRSVTHAVRLLHVWNSIGIEKKHTTAVINRSGAKFKEAVSSKDFERVCGKTIDAFLPNDIRTIAEAENLGKTLFEVSPSALAEECKRFATRFLPAGEQNDALARLAPQSQSAAGSGGLFASLLGKK